MRIGDLNKRIDIEAQTKASDGMGGFTTAWSAIASDLPAAIWPVRADEMIQAGQQTMVISHRIRMRYRRILRAGWRVKFAGRYFNIVSIVDPNTDHRWLDLMCKEATG